MNTPAFDWSQRRILVVEDDTETLGRLRALFGTVPLEGLELVSDGSEALPLLRRFPADLVLIEASPKGMDGLDLLRALRNREISPNPDVLVAVMVSMTDADRLRRMCGIGIESFVRKPVEPDVLLTRIAQAIANPHRFISSLTYFGPDRRKPRVSGTDVYIGHERRRTQKPAKQAMPPAPPAAPRAPVPPRALVRSDDEAIEVKPAAIRPPVDNTPIELAPARPKRPEPDEGWFEPGPQVEHRALSDEPLEVLPAKKKRDSGDWNEALGPKPGDRDEEEAGGIDVQAIVAQHLEWLQSAGRTGTKATLDDQDTSGADLPGVNLSGASMRNVRLSGANLRGAVLQSADLRGADLSGADISQGDLASSNMRRADLSIAKLIGATFAGADLAGASLRGADLSGTDLRAVNLLDADLATTDLSTATGLMQAQVNKARMNVDTVLPPGLRRPARE